MLKILIADDHELIRDSVKLRLGDLEEEISIFEAGTYSEIDDLKSGPFAGDSQPDIILLDLHMPGVQPGNKFAGLSHVQELWPDASVIVFSADEDAMTIATALENGARGYFPKSMHGRTLQVALKLVIEGEVYIPPTLATQINSFWGKPETANGVSGGQKKPLSERELSSLKLLTNGMTNKEIARELGLRDVTIKMHLRNAFKKLGANNRVEAVRIAVESGIVNT